MYSCNIDKFCWDSLAACGPPPMFSQSANAVDINRRRRKFYSSGEESVLVKWHIENPELKQFIPRTPAEIRHVNIVNQNILSKERAKILYNINVTKAAFNIDWMVTGEVFNDEEHLPELRLKFWRYQEETQNYALNTNIELPHEGGFKTIEFSNDYQVEIFYVLLWRR
ncbi:WD repeat-containing protein 75 [Eumeta japonica]|uniref:WD repeat-containing protein 75 n=1 Tax=Eumeta variegata TaxID=151549 RepID=A0A4C1T6V4_EUMVA|nr:WD repeat-containing protein 75 [Eumeta japonica]